MPPPAAPEQLIPAGHVLIATDGGCRPNPGRGAWAAIIVRGDEEIELCGYDEATTNNRMELQAAISALERLPAPALVTFQTDSKYLLLGATKWIPMWRRRGWMTVSGTPVLNVDLWHRLASAMTPHTITWRWVKGHAGHRLNERADRLCQAQRYLGRRAIA